MDIKKLIKHFIYFASVAYTLMSMLIVIAGLSLPESTYASIGEPVRFLYLLLFALILALGSTIKRIDGLSAVVARLLHAVCFIGGFFAFLLMGSMEFSSAVVSAAIFAVVYIVLILVKGLIRKGISKNNARSEGSVKPQKKTSKKQEYTKQF